jgi:hypothetical protein
MEQTTIDGYKDIYNRHIKTVADSERATTDLQLLERVDMLVRALRERPREYTRQKSEGERNYKGMSESEKTRLQKIAASHDHAYTLEEVAVMMEKLPEPARTVCTVTAFIGLSRSELRGLRWEDYAEKARAD